VGTSLTTGRAPPTVTLASMSISALPRSSPGSQGVDPAGILAFLDTLDSAPDIEMHSLMIIRHGQVVAEGWWSPYAPEQAHLLYSLSKSFTSTAAAFAVAEGLLNLDATVLSYFPERCRSIRSNLCAGSCSARLIGSRAACSPTTSRVRTPSPRSSSG
jgi:CubicO group peptidase (beta-lactamase class C family)